jgi:plasmid stability protein
MRREQLFPEQIAIRVPAEISEGLRSEAARRGADMSDVAREYLSAGLGQSEHKRVDSPAGQPHD